MLRSELLRKKLLKKWNLLVPMGIGISPTMRCNLSCTGCYSRLHPREDEMSPEVIDSLIEESSNAGVFLYIVTGGEPFIRSDLMEIYQKYPHLMFLIITNGTLLDEELVRKIADSGNIIPVLSIEGNEEETDERRGKGVYSKVLKAMKLLKSYRVPFGFSAVATRKNIAHLGDGNFMETLLKEGCRFGFFTDFIPIASDDFQLLPEEEQLKNFRNRLRSIKEEGEIFPVHLPDDEYDKTGRCRAVGEGGMHINAQGFVEPCPFAHFARENIKDCSFLEVLRSPFLNAIRNHPDALRHGKIGCSLVNNHDLLEEIASTTGAMPTRAMV